MKCHRIIAQIFRQDLTLTDGKQAYKLKSVTISRYYFKLNELILLYTN